MMAAITRQQIEDYLRLQDEQRELERRARSLGKERSELAATFRAVLDQSGKNSIRRCGHQISLVDGRVQVKWRDEFIRLAGSDAADEIVQNKTPSQSLVVTPL